MYCVPGIYSCYLVLPKFVRYIDHDLDYSYIYSQLVFSRDNSEIIWISISMEAHAFAGGHHACQHWIRQISRGASEQSFDTLQIDRELLLVLPQTVGAMTQTAWTLLLRTNKSAARLSIQTSYQHLNMVCWNYYENTRKKRLLAVTCRVAVCCPRLPLILFAQPGLHVLVVSISFRLF